MQLALRKSWRKDHCLSNNPMKTSKQKNEEVLIPPKLCNTALAFSKTVKYQSIMFESNLNWSLHLKSPTQKVVMVRGGAILRNRAHKRRLIPKAAIHDFCLTYGILWRWSPSTRQKKVLLCLNRIQRIICCGTTEVTKICWYY